MYDSVDDAAQRIQPPPEQEEPSYCNRSTMTGSSVILVLSLLFPSLITISNGFQSLGQVGRSFVDLQPSVGAFQTRFRPGVIPVETRHFATPDEEQTPPTDEPPRAPPTYGSPRKRHGDEETDDYWEAFDGVVEITLNAVHAFSSLATGIWVRQSMAFVVEKFKPQWRYIFQPFFIAFFVPLTALRALTNVKRMKMNRNLKKERTTKWLDAVRYNKEKGGPGLLSISPYNSVRTAHRRIDLGNALELEFQWAMAHGFQPKPSSNAPTKNITEYNI